MWYYVTPVSLDSSNGSRTFEEFRRKVEIYIDRAEALAFDLEQKGIHSKTEYSDSLWVRTRNNREFTMLTFLLMRHNCEIGAEVTEKELKEIADKL